MPLEPATRGDRAAKGGMVRSHRFAAANTALPHLRGDDATVSAVAAALRDKITLALREVDAQTLDVVLRARGVGHRFPDGTMDSNEVWLAVEAQDARGRPLAHSGALDEKGRLGVEAHRLRAQPVDEDASPLLRRDVQHTRSIVYDTAIAPSDPAIVRYSLPANTASVDVRLFYRKFSAEYARFACAAVHNAVAHARCVDVPRIEIAHARLELGMAASRANAPWSDLLDYGIALADARADEASFALPFLERARAAEPTRVEPLLGLMRVSLALGRTDELVALAAAVRKLAAHPAADFLESVALLRAYRIGEARTAIVRLVSQLPRDRKALLLAARIFGLSSEPARALATADQLVALDPQLEEAYHERALALEALGQVDAANAATVEYLRRRLPTELQLALRNRWLARRPGLPDESLPLHVHALQTHY